MKKIGITFLLLLFSFSFAFAQANNQDDEDTTVTVTVKTVKKPKPKEEVKPTITYPKHAVGLTVGVNHSFGYLDLVVDRVKLGGTHASAGFEYKRTFNKWFGMFVNLGYDYQNFGLLTKYGEITNINPHTFNFNFLFAFQMETPKGKSGFVPYVGVGPSLQFAGPLNFAPGIALAAGLRYNFSFGLYLELGFDYQYNINVLRNFAGQKPNTHQVRGKVAVGYRYK